MYLASFFLRSSVVAYLIVVHEEGGLAMISVHRPQGCEEHDGPGGAMWILNFYIQ